MGGDAPLANAYLLSRAREGGAPVGTDPRGQPRSDGTWSPASRRPWIESRDVRRNRSMPPSEVIPVLGYPDVAEPVAWLGGAFGFVERWWQ